MGLDFMTEVLDSAQHMPSKLLGLYYVFGKCLLNWFEPVFLSLVRRREE